MKRADIASSYTIDRNSIIRDPGKFEGEMIYAPYYYDASMDGFAEQLASLEDSSEYACLVKIDDSDRAQFPELSAASKFILLRESDQGFVFCCELTGSQADKAREEYESDQQDDEAESEDE